MSKTCNDIRNDFIEFFRGKHEHTFVPSSSLLPADDPTLLFTNAGMNQFKPIFLGTEQRDYVRAVNSQKCIRAGGKHNDLEDVGHDTYHHTFFEMLGNWSFGDYFKREAIDWAWRLLTEVWGLPAERLHATVFQGDPADGLAPDTEAAELWRQVTDIDPAHIHLGDKKDNFWEMGETGPCGPCSEIHYDFTEDLSGGPLVNAGDARVIEIWNLVFIQFNRGADGKLSPLPAKHVDTGMGLERIARVLQGVDSNYDTDVFRGIFDACEKLAAAGPYTGGMEDRKDIAYRVVADHVRGLTFAIADGVRPSNEGRGYVLRRILRRACRYGRQELGMEGAFLCKLVPTVVERMGEAFPEIRDRRQAVVETIRQEEESFGKTLDRGIELFARQADRLAAEGAKDLPGEVAFDLYATYGFPVDLTQIMAAERGMTVDMVGFQKEMDAHAEKSRGGGGAFKVEAIVGLPATNDSAKYSTAPLEASVLGWVTDGEFCSDGELAEGEQAAVVLDMTNFYGEQGGQVGDAGMLMGKMGVFDVQDTKIAGQCVLHVGEVRSGKLSAADKVTATVCPKRMDTMRNHSATHLLNFALRQVLGEEVHQAGSEVDPERLRFDFTHGLALTDEQAAQVERIVNDFILDDAPVTVRHMPLDEAKKLPGVRAVFGEKYPDPVRVVTMGAAGAAEPLPGERRSVEFCGGTHLQRTGQVGLLKIVAEESVAKGVRRISAVTGRKAIEWVQQADGVLKAAARALRVPAEQVPERIVAMQKEIKDLRKRPAGAAAATAGKSEALDLPGGKVVVIEAAQGADAGALRQMCDQHRQKGAAGVFVGAAADGKVMLVAMVDEGLAKAGKLKAGDWVREVAPVVGGAGGGKPTLAQAGGKQPERLSEALHAAAEYARRRLG